MAHILLAEDDKYLCDGLSRSLRFSGHKIDVAKTGPEAEDAVGAFDYDLLILDIGLPYKSGFEILSWLRSAGKTLPVLILTARDTLNDRIHGLDLGANDYLCKPFDMGELEARIRALLRKEKWDNQTKISSGNLSLDVSSNQFYVDEELLELTLREFKVLEFLMQKKGKLVMREKLLDYLFDLELDITGNALDIVIHRLRKKMEKSTCSIKTVKGLGFIIENK
ncbi:MAG: response regulator transcription factor [Candidatus Melainabacteria bacterium]|nr:response regulator transcription factor [Candidatus Melainabacteria bacterium]